MTGILDFVPSRFGPPQLRLDSIDPRVVDVIGERLEHAYRSVDTLMWSVLEVTSCPGSEISTDGRHAYAGINFNKTDDARPKFLLSNEDFGKGAPFGVSLDFAICSRLPPDLNFDILDVPLLLGEDPFRSQRDRVAYVGDHEIGHFLETFALGSVYHLGLPDDIASAALRDRSFQHGLATGVITDGDVRRIEKIAGAIGLSGIALRRFVADSFTCSPTTAQVMDRDEARRERNADVLALWLSGRKPDGDPVVAAARDLVTARLTHEGRQHADEMRFVSHVTRVLDRTDTPDRDRRLYSELRDRFAELSLSDDDIETATTGRTKPSTMLSLTTVDPSRLGKVNIRPATFGHFTRHRPRIGGEGHAIT